MRGSEDREEYVVRILVYFFAGACAWAQADERVWEVHFQATSIGQEHGSFPSLYEGENSLPPHPEHRVSITATIFLSLKLNRHWEFVVHPEVAGGRGFGLVTGIAGFTNGEIPRVSSATPTLYPARAYVKYTDDGFSIQGGKFAVTDMFDNNTYSHDPRTQFMNWSLMYNGAWDYPADTRGYTVGFAAELKRPSWALRAASVMEPTTANGPIFDTRIARNRGFAAEWEHDHKLAGRTGALRVLVFDNLERAGVYRESLSIRRPGTSKYGFGFNVEQQLTQDAGVFGRYGWNDGKTETWAFTEIDRSLSGGFLWKGARWRRPQDAIGVGAVQNYITGDHRVFLASGGYGFIIGDGRLDHYAPEQIVETYYAWRATRSWTVTLDYQHITNPAYNADRGPVGVATLRLHWER